MIFANPARKRSVALAAATAALVVASATGPTTPAAAEALLLIEADSGRVLHAENATTPWYPASVTKVMTAYVTLKAVKEGRIALDTLLTVSPNAVAQAPSKMGFKVGSQITVDNALKMLMVKSANDVAVVLAEGVAGSIPAFAEQMNRAAARLGMTQTTYVNPNGLPADAQVTSARDQAILARAVYRELPEYELYWRVSAIRFGKRVMRNYNTLLDRYPGTDGLKTGFICASGFNVVVSAKRNDRRLIAVVLGAPSGPVRAVKAAQMLERGFQGGGFSWLAPTLGTVETLKAVAAEPPNLRDEICGKKRKRPAAESEDHDEGEAAQAALPPGMDPNSPQAVMLSSLRTAATKPSSLIGPLVPSMEPIEVYLGPARGKGQPAVQLADGKPRKSKKDTALAAASAPGRLPAAVTPAAPVNPIPITTPAFAAAPSYPSTATFTPAPAATTSIVDVPMPKPRPQGIRTAAKPAAAKPTAAKPDAAKPDAAKPAAAKPTASKPDATKPGAAKPGASQTAAKPAKPSQPAAR